MALVPPANDEKAHPAGRVLGEGLYVQRSSMSMFDFIWTNVQTSRPLTLEDVTRYRQEYPR